MDDADVAVAAATDASADDVRLPLMSTGRHAEVPHHAQVRAQVLAYSHDHHDLGLEQR